MKNLKIFWFGIILSIIGFTFPGIIIGVGLELELYTFSKLTNAYLVISGLILMIIGVVIAFGSNVIGGKN